MRFWGPGPGSSLPIYLSNFSVICFSPLFSYLKRLFCIWREVAGQRLLCFALHFSFFLPFHVKTEERRFDWKGGDGRCWFSAGLGWVFPVYIYRYSNADEYDIKGFFFFLPIVDGFRWMAFRLRDIMLLL
ncbi:hypothetical protein GGI42DRAFT_109665 [Trichoderma sp. SZMC 28013]